MIAVFGKTGQVAKELIGRANVRTISRDEADLTDIKSCAAALRKLSPDAVINAAAYTAVDKAEGDEATANLVNGDAPAAIAEVCADLDIPLVHISTDYVFDGRGNQPFLPEAATGPLNAYGRSKLKGEKGVLDARCTYAILRTSWVFSAHGDNFLKAMLRLGVHRKILSIVADQVGGPTPASAIASVCLDLATELQKNPGLSGTYHFSGSPDVSWADFAREIFRASDFQVRVEDIATCDYPTPAIRPTNSRLDCTSLEQIGVERPDWQAAMRKIIKQLGVSA